MSSQEESSENNAPIAFALVIAASASTAIGAAVVFIPSLVKLASRKVLAGSLGLSAGVMTYVSFSEIFGKSMRAFENAGHDGNRSYVYATACFFGGVVTMILLNVTVGQLLGDHGHRRHDEHEHHHRSKKSTRKSVDGNVEAGPPKPPCCVSDPVEQLNTFRKMASVLEHEIEDAAHHVAEGVDDNFVDNLSLENSGNEEEGKTEEKEIHMDSGVSETENIDETGDEKIRTGSGLSDTENNDKTTTAGVTEETAATNDNSEENSKLVKMGLNTAVAIGLHNFPEGLATFVAALEDPKVGAVLAVAIAIHNIPEGLCVALPMYYATGNRCRSFLWAVFSGASELVAAFLGWLVLANTFSDVAFAVLFGLVAGMMVIISIRELLPTAHFYDPDDCVVTYFFIGGMALMAFSLVLFKI